MKATILANFGCVCLFASALGQLPEPDFADTEVTTNIAFTVNREWRSAVMTIGASLAV